MIAATLEEMREMRYRIFSPISSHKFRTTSKNANMRAVKEKLGIYAAKYNMKYSCTYSSYTKTHMRFKFYNIANAHSHRLNLKALFRDDQLIKEISLADTFVNVVSWNDLRRNSINILVHY